MTLYVIGYKDRPPSDSVVVNTTSRSSNWSKGLSPFFLGDVDLYDNLISKNVENAWQGSKVYKEHIDDNGDPTDEYFEWAKDIWNDTFAHRYPMGKGSIPEYSFWKGEKLDYISARKKVYAPLYAKAVLKTREFQKLKTLYNKCKQQDVDMYLLDFDGYNHIQQDMDFSDVINCSSKKMGHGFVLWWLLENNK